jgi:hypothetical protein
MTAAKREHDIRIPVTPAELRAIRAAAKREALPIATWARRILNWRATVTADVDAICKGGKR